MRKTILIFSVLFMVGIVLVSAYIERYSDTRAVYRKTLNTPKETQLYNPFNLILVDVSSYNGENIVTICTNKDKTYSELFISLNLNSPPHDFDENTFINITSEFLYLMKPSGGFDMFGCRRMWV